MANSPKLRGTYDLLGIIALTALLTICIVFITSDIPRIIIGVPFLLFFPGYTLIAAMFPRRDSLAGVERAALSLALSVAVVPLIGLVLNYVWEISVYPILISITAFVALMCVLAFLRRSGLPPQERFEPKITLHIPQWGRQSPPDRVLFAVLAIAVIGAAATAIYVAVRPKTPERFTEFYLLGSQGTMEYYPQQIVLGASADVTVGVVNHEGDEITYRVRAGLDGTELRTIEGVALRDGDTWEETVTLAPTRVGDNQKVEFLLYRDGESEPYQELHLWIDVIDTES